MWYVVLTSKSHLRHHVVPPVVRVCACSLLPHRHIAHMTSFVRIALVGAGSFAKMEIHAGDDISDLAKRACAEFPSWKADSAQLSLYLVAAGGDDMPPTSAVVSARHLDQVGWSLSRAGISSGAWLVARKFVDGGASFSCFARVCPIMHTATLRL